LLGWPERSRETEAAWAAAFGAIAGLMQEGARLDEAPTERQTA
jgi:hypothetical protein